MYIVTHTVTGKKVKTERDMGSLGTGGEAISGASHPPWRPKPNGLMI